MAVKPKIKRKASPRRSRRGLWAAFVGLGMVALVVFALRVLPTPFSRSVQTADGPPAPDFTVPTLDGGTFTLSEHRGKPVIVFIMAYWCGTCVPEAQALAQLQEEYGDQVTIVALDVDPSSTPERLAAFKQFVGNPDYIWAFDKGGVVTQAYRVRALDTTFIISPTGNIVYTDTTPTPYDQLKVQIARLLEGA